MERIIQGSELGSYKTIAMALGQAEKENNNGIKSKYIVCTIKNKKSLGCKARRLVFFEEDLPGAFECLKAFASQTPDAQGGYPVNLAEFRADANAMEEWGGLLEWPGGMTMEYELQKGLCYQNDIDGNRVIDKNTNKPIMKDTITVFVQVDMLKPGKDGNIETVYIDGLGLAQQGQRMESRFYREAVQQAPITTDTTDDVPPLSTDDAAPAGRPF